MDQDATWYESGTQPKQHCVRWGHSSPGERGTAVPLFSAHVYCGQTAGWINMPLGTKVGLGPGHIVLDGDPAPPLSKKRAHPEFSAHVSCGQTVAYLSYC